MHEMLRQQRHSRFLSLVWGLDGMSGGSFAPSLAIRVGFSVSFCLFLHVWRRVDAPLQTREQATMTLTSGGSGEAEPGRWTCRSPRRSFFVSTVWRRCYGVVSGLTLVRAAVSRLALGRRTSVSRSEDEMVDRNEMIVERLVSQRQVVVARRDAAQGFARVLRV